MNSATKRGVHVALVMLLALIEVSSSAGRASAADLTPAFVATNIDWTWAAVGGVGGGNRQGGSATITLTGVNGPVKQALLYWHGIDNFTPRTSRAHLDAGAAVPGSSKYSAAGSAHTASCDGVYNVPNISLDGNIVDGVPLGDAETNCWGQGSSRAFRADVTAIVGGNGIYTLSNMTADECDDANGASLIVTFDDGNPANSRDLVFCEGNDSNLAFGFPGETDGWNATLPGIAYTAGKVAVQLHLADGQNLSVSGLDDDTVRFSANGQTVAISDDLNRYDGTSVPDAGFSRSEALGKPGSLWDVHTFDISPIFTAPGRYTLTLDGQLNFTDCTGLVLAIVDLQSAEAQVSTHAASWGNVKAMYR